MALLDFCGAQVERLLEWRRLMLLFVVGAYAAAVAEWLLIDGVSISASGAISASVAAFALSHECGSVPSAA